MLAPMNETQKTHLTNAIAFLRTLSEAAHVTTALSTLRGDTRCFCAIGGLLEYHRQVKGGEWQGNLSDNIYDFVDTRKGVHSAGMEPSLLNEFGMTDRQQDRVISLNDGSEFTFIEIADWIEKNILGN